MTVLTDTPKFLAGIDIEEYTDEGWETWLEGMAEPGNPTDFILDLIREAKGYEAEAAAIALRQKELADKKARKERAAQRLRDWAKAEMIMRDLSKCKDADYTVSLAKPKAKLVVIRSEDVPDDYWRMERRLDKTALNEAFNETGEVPDGCDVAETRTLTVRG